MSNIGPLVKKALLNFVESQDGHHTASDVLRVIAEEANLMKETQDVYDNFDSDPMEQLEEVRPQVDRLKKLMKVTSCSRVRTGDDYCHIHATVMLEKCDHMQLTFKYERKKRPDGPGCHVWYSIELSINYGPRENLMVVQVWAPSNFPSIETAMCVHDVAEMKDIGEDKDGWADIDEEEIELKNGGTNGSRTPPKSLHKTAKKQKVNSQPDDKEAKNDFAQSDVEKDSEESTCDTFMTFLDPDMLDTFLECAKITPMNEGTAFFLLMTFPYYEHEWDLVGYVLDTIFGDGDEDEEDGDMSEG
jgi:hypothetical protein